MTELYIEGNLMEMGKIKIAHTFQINDVGEPKDRQLDYSLSFYIPETPKNVIVLEMLGVIGNTSTIPYRRLKAKLVENGVEVVPDGIITVSGKKSRGFKSYIYGGNVFLFNAIGSKLLNELDLTSVNHSVSLSNFINSFDNDEGYIYALSDFGKFRPVAEGVEINYQVPSIFVHTLWKLIFEQSGVEYYGDIFQDAKFKNLLLTTHRGYDSALDDINFPINVTTASYVSSASIFNNWTYGAPTPPQVALGIKLPEQANILPQTFGAPYPSGIISTVQAGTYTYSFNLVASINDVGLSYGVIVKIYKFNGAFGSTEIHSQNVEVLNSGQLSIDIDVSGEVYLEENTTLFCVIEYNRVMFGNESTTQFNQTITNFVFTNNNALTTLTFNNFLGDLSQIAFVKDVMQHFGLIFQKRKNKTAYDFIRIADLISDRTNTLDWSDKLVGMPSENYKLRKYAQSNRFAYNYLEQDSVRFADGLMKINNENLKSERTLVQRPYNAPTISETQLFNEDITYTPFWTIERNDDGTIKEFKPFSSKNYFVEKKMVNGTINYGLSGNTDINSFTGDVPIMDFSNLGYEQLLTENYTELKKVLDFNFVIPAELLLNEIDIQNLDLFKTIFLKQYSADFYINKIKYIDSSLPSKAELVKIKRNISNIASIVPTSPTIQISSNAIEPSVGVVIWFIQTVYNIYNITPINATIKAVQLSDSIENGGVPTGLEYTDVIVTASGSVNIPMPFPTGTSNGWYEITVEQGLVISNKQYVEIAPVIVTSISNTLISVNNLVAVVLIELNQPVDAATFYYQEKDFSTGSNIGKEVSVVLSDFTDNYHNITFPHSGYYKTRVVSKGIESNANILDWFIN